MDGIQGHMQGTPSQGAGDQPLEQRAGSYQKQLRGYRAFIPSRLPPESLTHNVFSQKHKVMVWLSRQTDVGPPKLDGAIFREGT